MVENFEILLIRTTSIMINAILDHSGVDCLDSIIRSNAEKEDRMTKQQFDVVQQLEVQRAHRVAEEENFRYHEIERGLKERELAEQARSNRAQEALKHESNEATVRAAELKKEGSVESASISSDTSKYVADLNDKAKRYAVRIDELLKRRELNIKDMMAVSSKELNAANINKVNADIQFNKTKLDQLERQLNGQLAMWDSMIAQNENNIDMAKARNARENVQTVLNAIDSLNRVGNTIINGISTGHKITNDNLNTYIRGVEALNKASDTAQNQFNPYEQGNAFDMDGVEIWN